MPLFFTRKSENANLGIWKISESLKELESMISLSLPEQERYNKFQNERRKKEWLASRILLKTIFPNAPKIAYTNAGKPFLPDTGLSISISHSQKFAALLLSETAKCGIDIEDTSRKIENIARKFLSEKEWEQLGFQNRIEKIFLHWCGKETIFKLVDDSGVDFARQIYIAPIPQLQTEDSILATFKNNQKIINIHLNYLFIEGHALTWALF